MSHEWKTQTPSEVMEDFKRGKALLEGKPTYWICSEAENKDFLESVGVVLGERVGSYWHGCQIPSESLDDLFEYWGSGQGDTVMFGLESEESKVPKDWSASNRVRVQCPLCHCVLREDGSCSLPLCRDGSYAQLAGKGSPRKAARLRQ